MKIVVVGFLLSVGVGCQKSEAKESLPPPTGPGAAPLSKLLTTQISEQRASEAASDRLVITGTALPIAEAKVGPKTTGVIASMLVEEGDLVKTGQLLFRLDTANQVLALTQSEAALSSAMVAESTAQTEFQRINALRERGSISPAVYDQVKAQLEAAQAAVNTARAALNRVKQAVVDTSVRSPISGVVSRRTAGVGDTVTVVPTSVILIIQDISELEIRGRVPETMLAKLKPGSSVTVRFPSIEVSRTVEITRINPSVDSMTRTVEVVARLPNRDHALKAGMLVELIFGEAADADNQSSGKEEALK
ncbi:MAG: efflux RND transporter periplasmic adaptor subunit [Deltaproteobacteria bacterium]|nr:efflux RND transporter periplasmic adaptor subunit [Deltaproteobacteria bacterium]